MMPSAQNFTPSSSPVAFESPTSWQQERQDVSFSGIRNWPSMVGAQLCNHQALNTEVAIAHLIIYLITV